MRTVHVARGVAAVLVALAACTPRMVSRSDTGHALGRGRVLIRVENSFAPPTLLTVWIVHERGGGRSLGLVRPTATMLARVDHSGAAARYQLVAETRQGDPVISPPFILGATGLVVWDVGSNTLTISEGPGAARRARHMPARPRRA